jgi:hypothetical protein
MRRSLPTALGLGAVVLILVILILAVAMPREAAAPSPTPSPTPTVTATATATSSPTASPSPSPSPSPPASPAGARFVSASLGYSIETPPPWRRSVCTSGSFTQQGVFFANDVFVAVSARDETGTDTGVPYPTVRVAVEGNPQNLTPRQWAEQGKTVGSTAGERIEEVAFAGRPAARKSFATTPRATYFVSSGPNMFVVIPSPGPTPIDAATEQTMVQMVESFRFLTDAELAAARAAATSTPLPARSPEAVADGVAAAFAAKDANALTGFLSPCVTTAGEQAGSSFVSREKYVDDLRAAFAAGLSVAVRPRPFEGDRASGDLTIGSTWMDSRGTKERKLMLRRSDNDRWEWHGTLERF